MGFKPKGKLAAFFILMMGACILLSFCPQEKSSKMNTNGWNVSIGKKQILTSVKNQRGDTAYIDKKMLHLKDSLFVSEFICGGTIKPPVIGLKIAKDDVALTELELSYNGWTSFIPLDRLSYCSDFKKLRIDIYSTYNYYYPPLDKDKPMCTLLIS